MIHLPTYIMEPIAQQWISSVHKAFVPDLYASIAREAGGERQHALLMEDIKGDVLYKFLFSEQYGDTRARRRFFEARVVDQLAMMATIQREAGVHCLDRNPCNFLWDDRRKQGTLIDHAHALVEIRDVEKSNQTKALLYTREWNMDKVPERFRWNMYYHFLWTQQYFLCNTGVAKLARNREWALSELMQAMDTVHHFVTVRRGTSLYESLDWSVLGDGTQEALDQRTVSQVKQWQEAYDHIRWQYWCKDQYAPPLMHENTAVDK